MTQAECVYLTTLAFVACLLVSRWSLSLLCNNTFCVRHCPAQLLDIIVFLYVSAVHERIQYAQCNDASTQRENRHCLDLERCIIYPACIIDEVYWRQWIWRRAKVMLDADVQKRMSDYIRQRPPPPPFVYIRIAQYIFMNMMCIYIYLLW